MMIFVSFCNVGITQISNDSSLLRFGQYRMKINTFLNITAILTRMNYSTSIMLLSTNVHYLQSVPHNFSKTDAFSKMLLVIYITEHFHTVFKVSKYVARGGSWIAQYLPTESAINCLSGFGSTCRFSTISLIRLWVLRARADARTSHVSWARNRRDIGTKLAEYWKLRRHLNLKWEYCSHFDTPQFCIGT